MAFRPLLKESVSTGKTQNISQITRGRIGLNKDGHFSIEEIYCWGDLRKQILSTLCEQPTINGYTHQGCSKITSRYRFQVEHGLKSENRSEREAILARQFLNCVAPGTS